MIDQLPAGVGLLGSSVIFAEVFSGVDCPAFGWSNRNF